MKSYPDSPLHQQIYNAMQTKSTDELVVMWEENDRTEWSSEAFEVLYDLLSERLEQVPAQKEPVYEKASENDEEDVDDTRDTYHIPSRLSQIVNWARNLSWIVLVAFIAIALMVVFHRFPAWLSLGFQSNGLFGSPLVMEGAWVVGWLAAGIVFFVVLQAIAEMIYILMDIEENTRLKP